MATPESEVALEQFMEVRPRMFGVAYRILGSAADAEDVVQDAWFRWQGTDRSVVKNARAFLTTTAAHLALNVLESARSRREQYVGPWLPEPVDTGPDPRVGAENGEALELAVLLLLEKLTPKERAAYVLREAFGYTYAEIANVLRLSEVNSRQLVTRARSHIANGRRAPVAAAEHRRLLDALVSAGQNGNVEALEGLFSADVVSYSDGGGLMRAARKPIVGRAHVSKFLGAVWPAWAGSSVSLVEANGLPAALLCREGAAVGFVAVAASAEGIDHVFWMLRPSKLAALQGLKSRS